MKTVAAGALAVGASLGAALAFAQAPKTDDAAAIRALEAKFAAAVSAKDVDAIMKVYAPDVFVFDVVPPRQYVGAQAYRQDWTEFMAGFKGPVKLEVSNLSISLAGAVAWSHSIQHVHGADPKGQATDVTVRVTDVYRKLGGRWLI